MSKIILQGHIVIPDADLAKVQEELITHKMLTRQESGCLTFEVTQDSVNSNKFNVYEEFTDQDAFDSHQLRVKNSNWGKVTINLQRHYQMSNRV
ncbi:antibiotic biosynthesis monooxygenase [Colwellia demingiae]|uniref:Antibiotic biosynthesis monooxygenase n=1 Tax=Colwellia demingiae TaxID=89401 RepID=A0A5C6Q3R6_9GAMM|nr:antibiotic biosynthesis monooxygenase [Colwellia demingiae]TWX63486.1 antibiotic biosynthesis monooxygenase [Colwellia demingiae]